VLAIEPGEVVFHHGNYDSYVLARQKRMESLEASAKRQERLIEKETKFINRFRSQATKASVVQSRIKRLEKIQVITIPRTTKKIHFVFPEPPHSGKEVISLRHIKKAYGDKVIYTDLNLTLNRGDRVTLVGPNGAGKTTLLKLLAGVLPFEAGERVLGANVITAYYAQYVLDLLKPENTVLEELARSAPDQQEQNLRRILGGFLFSGDDVRKRVAVLSGGEKARVALAKILMQPSNFLLMDEPTNHLDIGSREILADALEDYKGTICLITHDRTLIQQTANKIIEIQAGVPEIFPGDYAGYLYRKEHGAPPPVTAKAENKPAAVEPEPEEEEFDDGRGWVAVRQAPKKKPKPPADPKIALEKRLLKESKETAKLLADNEAEMADLEAQLAEIEAAFASPGFYADTAKVQTTMEKHHQLKLDIQRLTEEWEKLTLQAEKVQGEMEQAGIKG
jgi:ATP-binding cassette subfamily F protein 3